VHPLSTASLGARRHSTPKSLESQTRVIHRWRKKGADLTRPHERHREAPMRETRQAAPDGARASAALSSSESSRFSRGTKPLRRKSYGFVVMSSFAVISIAGNIFNKFRWRLQPSRTVRHISRRPATVPGDENLRAKTPAAAGGSRQERNARASKRATRRSLTRPPPPYHPRRFSSLTRRRAEWLAKRMQSGKNQRGKIVL